MKFSYASAVVALTAAAVLAGCGGKAQFTVQGTIAGLNNDGLVLANGSDTVTVPAGATTFTFPNQIPYGSSYAISIKTQPNFMTCEIGNNTGSAGHTVTIAAVLSCSQNAYTVGGQFTGLTPKTDGTGGTTGTVRSVTLLNGSSGGSIILSSTADGTGEFVFGTAVAYGQTYGVTVLTQPEGDPALVCSLTNNTGVMREAAITNVLLSCAPK